MIEGEVNIMKHDDGTVIYPDHDPFCIIYKLGPEHCNCTIDVDREFGSLIDD